MKINWIIQLHLPRLTYYFQKYLINTFAFDKEIKNIIKWCSRILGVFYSATYLITYLERKLSFLYFHIHLTPINLLYLLGKVKFFLHENPIQAEFSTSNRFKVILTSKL